MQFDLNPAILRWRDTLAQSPQFRAGDLAELESHLRDAVIQLQGRELSEEEAFLIATRRMGSVEQLEVEFGKVNRNPMNKIAHGLVLVFFSVACSFLWALLTASERTMMGLLEGKPLPAFTRLCFGLKSELYLLPLLALACCAFVWLRKTESRVSWMGFFAASTSVIILLTFPAVVAIYLPLVNVFVLMGNR